MYLFIQKLFYYNCISYKFNSVEEKLFDLFQKLASSPEGIRKILFTGFELAISLIVAFLLLESIFPMVDLSSIQSFSLENPGRWIMEVLVIISIIVLSWWFVAHVIFGVPSFVIQAISITLSRAITKKNFRFEFWIIREFFEIFQIAKFDKELGFTPLKYAEFFADFVQEFQEIDETEKLEINSDPIAEKVASITFGIGIVVWWLLPADLQVPYLSPAIIVILVTLVIFAILIRLVKVLIFKYTKEFEGFAKYLVIKRWVMDEMVVFRIHPKEYKPRKGDFYIEDGDITTHIVIQDELTIVRKCHLKKGIRLKEVDDSRMIVFTHHRPSPQAIEFVKQNKLKFTFVIAENREHVREVFLKYFG